MHIRPPAVSGTFYPADAQKLRDMVKRLLQQVSASSPNLIPKAMIVPHAGYVYSGPIAASVYAKLIPLKTDIKRVVLLGPAHTLPLRGLATTTADGFATPLGTVPIDHPSIKHILSLPQVVSLEKAHEREHSLEVQLPFLQEVLEEFTLIPLVVGETSPQHVAEVLEKLWGGTETLIIVSSDLSHYQDYQTAQYMDKLTSQAIEHLRPQDVHHKHACGCYPMNGLLYLAKAKGMHAKTIDLRNSGDTAGSRHQVVGYGAYVFH